jgi:hypothetical protein
VNREAARTRFRLAIDWVCHTLWLAQRHEPELVQFQAERGSTGFAHYIVSRAGILPDADWLAALYVLPPLLVDHLRQRCLELEPASYLPAALDAGASALRRLCPETSGVDLAELARASRPEGALPQAWFELPSGSDRHRELLWAAMTLREARAYVHYQAATAEGLQPLELLLVSAIWQGSDAAPVQRLFRWGDEEVAAAQVALQAGGWLSEQGEMTPVGRSRRDAIEAQTDAHTERLLAPLSDAELEQLTVGLPISG